MGVRRRECMVRLLTSGATAAALGLPWLPPAPRLEAAPTAAALVTPWGAWTPAASAESCEFALRFGRAWPDAAGGHHLPVQLRLLCEAPLADLRLTLDGKPMAMDLRLRGGSAQITTEIMQPAGSAAGNLCLTAVLVMAHPETISQCVTLPEPPLARAAAAPSAAAPPREEAAPPAQQAPAVPQAAQPPNRERRQLASPQAGAIVPTPPQALAPAPHPAGPRAGIQVLDFGGGALDPQERPERATPNALRTGPNTSLRLPPGHEWALEDPAKPAVVPVDNAIVRALRGLTAPARRSASTRAGSPAERISERSPAATAPAMPDARPVSPRPVAPEAAAPVPAPRFPSLPGLQVLDMSGGPVSEDMPGVPSPQEPAAPAPVEPEVRPETSVQRRAARQVQVISAWEVAPVSASPAPAMASDGLREPDPVVQRAARPPAAPVMPRVLVKAGDQQAAAQANAALLAGLLAVTAGALLRRSVCRVRRG